MPSPATLELRVLEAALALEAAPDVVVLGRPMGEPGRRQRRFARSTTRRLYAARLERELGVSRRVARREAFSTVADRRILEPRAAARMAKRDEGAATE